MQTQPISYLQDNANQLEVEDTLVITKDGKAAFVIQNIEDYEYQQESLALLKLLKLSEKSLQENPLSLDEAFE